MRNAIFPLAALLLITSGCAGDPCDTVACDAPPALTNAHGAVMATKPASMPLHIIDGSGFFVLNHHM